MKKYIFLIILVIASIIGFMYFYTKNNTTTKPNYNAERTSQNITNETNTTENVINEISNNTANNEENQTSSCRSCGNGHDGRERSVVGCLRGWSRYILPLQCR